MASMTTWQIRDNENGDKVLVLLACKLEPFAPSHGMYGKGKLPWLKNE
jgi:hypothetical protein